ncbi:hypothetical protein CcCBS67573_g04115 [Chytriomyces confervae]|uniref:DUF2421 domain-containing protein n=1 Tax=Chytriomyces confervae TaxID=246404 RepID=A0A507FH58_9FUNG|nr:hypothetical protein CcCBS67573_g04115 [Chytriomyces confervae]
MSMDRLARFVRAAVSARQAKDWFKALAAFILAFAFVFSSWATCVQPRSLGNIILMTIFQTPARTVGSFLDTSFLLIICILVCSAVWAFIQAVVGSSYTAMAVVLCVVVYCFSVLRATNPNRFLVPSLVGPLFVFTSVASVVGVNGRNTTGGELFDSNFLISTIKSYMIGIAICLAVNVLIFPDLAAPHLNQQFRSVVENLSSLLNSMLKTVNGLESLQEEYEAGVAERTVLVAKIQRDFGAIEMMIDQASGEISYSLYSIKDYNRILKSCKGLSAVLFSFNTSLKSDAFQRLLKSPEFTEQIAPSMRGSWSKIASSFKLVFDDILEKLLCASKTMSKPPVDIEAAVTERVSVAIHQATTSLQALESHRPSEFLQVISESNVENPVPAELREGWEKLLQVTFYTLACKHVVKELAQLHSAVHTNSESKLHIRFHVRHYLPWFLVQRTSPKEHKQTFGERLSTLKNWFLSGPSIFALKLSCAILCFLMVLYSQPATFQKWNLSGAFVTILVAISPSLGQTYLGLPVQIIGTTLGCSIAYGGIAAFGKDGAYGLTVFAALLAIPTFFLMFNPKTLILAILTLLSFSNFIVASYVNRLNPTFPELEVYLYRVIAVTSGALTFSVVFTLLIYPTLSRRLLREKLAELFRDFTTYFSEIMLSQISAVEASRILQDGSVNDTRNMILSKLFALQPLLAYSAAEPRLEGKFPSAKYLVVISSMHAFLDRLESLRVSGGDEPFDARERAFLKFGTLGEARHEMNTTLRMLLYVYSAAMATKARLPPALPNASLARDKLFHAFVSTIMNHIHNEHPNETDPLEGMMPHSKAGALETLSTEKWLRLLSFSSSAREVSKELDHFGELMKDLFGEYPDVFTKAAALETAQVVDSK